MLLLELWNIFQEVLIWPSCVIENPPQNGAVT